MCNPTFLQEVGELYRSPNATVALSKHCPFGVNTMIFLKYITTTFDSGGTLLVAQLVEALSYKPEANNSCLHPLNDGLNPICRSLILLRDLTFMGPSL